MGLCRKDLSVDLVIFYFILLGWMDRSCEEAVKKDDIDVVIFIRMYLFVELILTFIECYGRRKMTVNKKKKKCRYGGDVFCFSAFY